MWSLKIDEHEQGKHYDTSLTSGQSTQFFLLDGKPIQTPSGGCLSLLYRKAPVVGAGGVPLEVRVHGLGQSPPLTRQLLDDTGMVWKQERLEIPRQHGLTVLSFSMEVPGDDPSRAYHISLDDIRVEAGTCPK